jgi:hypothetical protein
LLVFSNRGFFLGGLSAMVASTMKPDGVVYAFTNAVVTQSEIRIVALRFVRFRKL